MCLANRTQCKQCLEETRVYYSKCDLYPEIKDETPTHSIRGRHRRIKACKSCKQKNREEEEAEEQRRVDDYPRAKAILEWRRLERPLPLTDSAISARYLRLFFQNKRLHPFCIGFTDFDRELIEGQRREFRHRAEQISAARMNIRGQMSDETKEACEKLFSEEKMFDEALRRQAEIDSGDRMMTESDRQFAISRLENTLDFEEAMRKIEDQIQRENLQSIFLEYWTSRAHHQFLTERSVQREIEELDLFLLASDASDNLIDKFRGEILRCHFFDESNFNFCPNDGELHNETPWLNQNPQGPMSFRRWAVEYERKMGGPLTPLFDRWYDIIDGYRAYLAQISPADYHKFNDLRNSIAANTFQVLLVRLHLRETYVEMDSDLEPSISVSSSEYMSSEIWDDEIENERRARANSESENPDEPEPEQEQQFTNIANARRLFNRVPESPTEEEELGGLLRHLNGRKGLKYPTIISSAPSQHHQTNHQCNITSTLKKTPITKMNSRTSPSPYQSCPTCGNNKSAVSDKIGLYESMIRRLETERKLLVQHNTELMAQVQDLHDFQGVGWQEYGEYLIEPQMSLMLATPPIPSMLLMPPTPSMFPLSQQASMSSISPSSPNYTIPVYADEYSNVEKVNEFRKAVDAMTREEEAKNRDPLHLNAKQLYRILRRRKARDILEERLRLRGGKVRGGKGGRGEYSVGGRWVHV
ncbi:hypothetical protein EYC80_002129 [Monilinia laxa]|uniref:Uncharacterized protein n=1 Tax=Monilinia laxa TaxID=61186 RepID=A0A5N6K362_MONLA|nr:hypothetical protein EYC80_002129 [Monilinia laxa]